MILATIATAGGGCAVDQAAEVAGYQVLLDLGPIDDPAPGEPVTLETAIRLTNRANESLAIAGERFVQAQALRRRATAALLPTLDLVGSLSIRDRADGPGEGGGSSSDTTLFDAGPSAQYTLLTGLSDFNSVTAADLTVEQQTWALLDVREALLLQTATSYYQVLLAERLVSVLESSLAVQEERLRDIRGRRQAGFARPLDVAQIEAQASETRVSLLDARNAVATARSSLTLLTGTDMDGRPLSDGFEPPAETPALDELLARATVGRQDLAAAAAGAAAARATVDAAIGRYYPTVTVNLEYFLTRDTLPTGRDWTSLLVVSLPLFSAGRIDADVRDAWSRFRETVLGYSLTERGIRRDVEVARVNDVSTRARVVEIRNQVAAAQEALRQAEAAYGAGLGTNLERVSAQDQLLSAQLRAAREEYGAKIRWLELARSAGTLAATVTGAEPVRVPLPAPRDRPESPFLGLPGRPATATVAMEAAS